MSRLIGHPMFPFVVIGLICVLIVAAIGLIDLYQRPPKPDFRPGEMIVVGSSGERAQVIRLRYDGWWGENNGWLVDCVFGNPEIPNSPVLTFRADELMVRARGSIPMPACQTRQPPELPQTAVDERESKR